MKPTERDFVLLEAIATVTRELDRYVWLREDEQGRYIEYAFIKGAPHDNRCLSWLDKPHPNFFKRRTDVEQFKIKDVNELYYLTEQSCGYKKKKEGDDWCAAGHPRKGCVDCGIAKGWTYDEPIKCACWLLSQPEIPSRVNISLIQAVEYSNLIKQNKNDLH